MEIYIIILILAGYIMGSFPTAIIVGRLSKGIDIREHGSGNAGGTNVFRVLGWKLGVFVMIIDMLKGFLATGFLPIWLSGMYEPSDSLIYFQLLSGFAAIIGHIWTVFAGFRGGKGVGTAAGLLFAVIPQAAIIGMIVFFSIFLSTRYVSLSSMIAAIAIPLTLLVQKFIYKDEVNIVMLSITGILAFLIIYTHRSNIKRLLDGTESKISSLKGGNAK